jgi:pimeloyl-ACP methyl ester carboxylesterase
MPYYLMLPAGERPRGGWRMVVLIHGQGGNGRDMLNIFAPLCYEAGIMLVAPTFPDAGDGRIFYADAALMLNDALDGIWAYQDDNGNFIYRYNTTGGGPVLAGFSAGAAISALFAHDYAYDLAGVMLMGLPLQAAEIPLPPRVDLPFRITVGELDERFDSARTYFNRISGQGNAARFFTITNSGHTISTEEIEILIEFVNEIYGG